MKKHLYWPIAAGAALCANLANAGGLEGYGIPSNMDFYAGGSAGKATQASGCDVLNHQTTCEDSSNGYKLFAGTRLKPAVQTNGWPALGAEIGYMDLGESKAEGILSRRNDADGNPIPIGSSAASSDVAGVYAAATAFMPVAPRTEVLGKLGFMRWSQDQAVTTQEDGEQAVSTSSTDSGFSGMLGAGAQYQLNDNLSLRGEYEKVFGVGKDGHETDPALLSVGAVFSTL